MTFSRKFLFLLGLALFSSASQAHHNFAAEFDEKRPVTLTGTVTKFEFINPHSWIHMDIKTPSGKVESWMVEGGSPNSLLRLGFTKNSLPFGSQITVQGFRALDGSNKAAGGSITFSDGKQLFLGLPALEEKRQAGEK